MQRFGAGIVAAASALFVLAGCASVPGANSVDHGAGLQNQPTTNGRVFSGPALWEKTGSVLSFILGRVGNMQVRETTGCPDVIIRGRKTILGSPNPRVYVDGTRVNDTCVLDQMQTNDVERVEVYPSGVTRRPGYLSHPHGLILLFTRRAVS